MEGLIEFQAKSILKRHNLDMFQGNVYTPRRESLLETCNLKEHVAYKVKSTD